jgi:hypothetical protein
MHLRVVRAFILLALAVSAGAAASARAGVAVPVVPQASAAPSKSAQPNTWSATTSSGGRFMGTWTYSVDPATGAVSGAWTLIDAQNRTLARGGWSAAKSPTGWTGGWRAAASGSTGEYSGTWDTSLQLAADAPFAELFRAAAQAVVSGTWRAGPQRGAWSIRVTQ